MNSAARVGRFGNAWSATAAGAGITAPAADTTRAMLAAFIIWIQSGTPIQSSFGLSEQTWLVIGLVAQVLICVRGAPKLNPIIPFMLAAMLYIAWGLIATLAGIEESATGCLGMVVRLTLVALPIVYLQRPLVAVVRSMVIICYSSVFIFAVRQVGLLAGFDIANAFLWVYQIASLQANPSIFIYTFHWVGEESRNSGFFREPGMFAANISMAYLMLIGTRQLYSPSEVKKYLILFLVALLTTSSTTLLGILPILILLALPIFITKKQSRVVYIPLLMAFSSIIFLILLITQLDKIESQLGTATNSSYAQTSWYNTRFGNFQIDYDAIVERPLLGYGFKEKGRPGIFMFYKDNHFIVANDSLDLGLGDGLSGTIVKFGLIMSLGLYALFFVRLVDFYNSFYIGFFSFLCLGVVLFGQQVLLLPVIYMFLASFNFNIKRRGRVA